MKKICFSVFALACLGAIVSCGVLLGNGDDLSKSSVSLTEKEKRVIGEFSVIGQEHNAVLADFYGLQSNGARAVQVKGEAKDFAEYFQIDESTVSVVSDFSAGQAGSRSVSDGETLVELLDGQIGLNADAKGYILKVESLLLSDSEQADVAEVQNSITYIEKEAIANLEGDSLVQFMSYAETAKASLEFWTTYYEVLDENSAESARGLFSFIKNQLNKAKWAAASDAAGAAAGAITGAIIGSLIPGVGSAAGAAAGAIVAGAASSAEGYKTGKLCVIVSPTSIQNRLR